jgi:hypothetical protein
MFTSNTQVTKPEIFHTCECNFFGNRLLTKITITHFTIDFMLNLQQSIDRYTISCYFNGFNFLEWHLEMREMVKRDESNDSSDNLKKTFFTDTINVLVWGSVCCFSNTLVSRNFLTPLNSHFAIFLELTLL